MAASPPLLAIVLEVLNPLPSALKLLSSSPGLGCGGGSESVALSSRREVENAEGMLRARRRAGEVLDARVTLELVGSGDTQGGEWVRRYSAIGATVGRVKEDQMGIVRAMRMAAERVQHREPGWGTENVNPGRLHGGLGGIPMALSRPSSGGAEVLSALHLTRFTRPWRSSNGGDEEDEALECPARGVYGAVGLHGAKGVSAAV
ncbi:hypothetical protein C8R43DRAFT_942599 [Mycena crocata]|nr:hypothetical protein C8R43DRAFT_942599 [Mycena crocata]